MGTQGKSKSKRTNQVKSSLRVRINIERDGGVGEGWICWMEELVLRGVDGVCVERVEM